MSVIYGKGFYKLGGTPVPKASLTPKSGVTYISGLSSIEPAKLTILSQAISNNGDITSETNTVYVDYKTTHVKIDIGNQVTIALNGTNYIFDVIGFNHDALTDANAYGEETATGKAGITFQMHDLTTTLYEMNSTDTNSGGWKSSAMRTSTMPIMKGYLPSAWQTAIKPVNKASGVGGNSSGTETVSDSCFLLSEIEVFGRTKHSVTGEGTQYAYYKAGNSKVKNRGDRPYQWWERSPKPGKSTLFCIVGAFDDAASYTNATNGSAVAFGFCV